MVVRMREAPKIPVHPEKDTWTISFKVTKGEKEEIKKHLTHFGELSFILRNALKKWLAEKKNQEAMLQKEIMQQSGTEMSRRET